MKRKKQSFTKKTLVMAISAVFLFSTFGCKEKAQKTEEAEVATEMETTPDFQISLAQWS